jgi:uncharacterized protein with HEPN domain
MPKDDGVRIRHMLDSANEAVLFISGKVRRDLDNNRMLVLSLVKCIEIIGEAAVNLSPETKRNYASIPWPDIISMRNRLIHAYYDVDIDRVWDTIADDILLLVMN